MRYILYHANCPDGFGAAYAAWKKFGNDAEYIPVKHGESPPDMKYGWDTEIYIVDFSYPRDILIEMYGTGSRLMVLDHHKTAHKESGDLGFVHFDMNRSGAVIAWEYFHPNIEVPQLLLHIQDRDLWQWQLEETETVLAGLDSYKQSFDVWDSLSSKLWRLQESGIPIVRVHRKHVQQLVDNAYWGWIGDYNVPMVNVPYMYGSDVCAELLARHPGALFSAYYFDENSDIQQVGLRGRGDFDVSIVAKSFGGGGHHDASGFRKIRE